MTARRSKRIEREYSDVLMALFALMLTHGIQAQDIFTLCRSALEQAEARKRLTQRRGSSGLLTAALVLDAWHRERRYMNSKAEPKAGALVGPAASVEALIRIQRGSRRVPHVVRRLQALGLVVRCGRGLYKPTSDAAIVSEYDPVVLQHAARALSTLLETVGQNVNGSRHLAPLIEPIAEVPDLPREHIGAFQRFTQNQGRTFLRTVNDWLESRRARRSRRAAAIGTVRAGIHTYAYIASKQSRRTSLFPHH